MSPLHSAELNYEALCRETPGVTRSDVDLDLQRLELIASACADTVRKAWREYRSTSDPGSRCEFDLQALTRQFTDAVAQNLGFSAEAAVVLDEMAKSQFA
ncbi:MAG TPA: hypothetical protein VFN88_00930 [Caulobacteraceae bacterium]|nr:hypothetical protein [Caulobacteraceae bacterium]